MPGRGKNTKPMPKSPAGGKRERLDSSKSSANSSYRDSSRYDHDTESSQDSQLDDSLNDSQDSPDNASYLSSADSIHNSSRDSPYSKSRQQLEDVQRQYHTGEDKDALGNLHISPMSAKLSPLVSPENKELRRRSPRNLGGGGSSFYDQNELSDGSVSYSPTPRESIHREYHRTTLTTRYRNENSANSTIDNANYKDKQLNIGLFECLCMGCIFLVVILIYVFVLAPVKEIKADSALNSDVNSRGLIVERFESKFKELMLDFPKQSQRFWRVLKSTTKRVMKDPNPRTPAVLLIVGNKGAFDSVNCIVSKFSDLTATAFEVTEPIEIKATETETYLPEKLKLLLDKKLSAAFQETKVAVIHNIDKIAGEAAMIFHSYCDNEFAPFKDSVIMFTMHMESDTDLTSDNQVETYLEGKWEDQLDKDRRAALIYSRIANSIAVVNKEDSETISKICT